MEANKIEYLTKKEIAARLRCSTRCIDDWMVRGLPHIKFGTRKTLFIPSEVDAFLKEKFHTSRN